MNFMSSDWEELFVVFYLKEVKKENIMSLLMVMYLYRNMEKSNSWISF